MTMTMVINYDSRTVVRSLLTNINIAFYECSGFTGSLTIPNSVTTIGNSATLASIRRNEDAKGGELICSGNKTVGGW